METEKSVHTNLPAETFNMEHLPQKHRLKALLAMRGISQIEVAKKYQFQRSEVSRVISGDRKTRRIREAIAQELGLPFVQLFPKK